MDRLLDVAESAVSVGVRELCCRLGTAGGSFARSAENLAAAAQVRLSEETLRRVVESEGKAVLAASEDGQLEIDWCAADCLTPTPAGGEVSRVYVSGDGVLVPVTTAAEKRKRRATVLRHRRQEGRQRRRGPGVRPRPRLPSLRRGADQRYKQFNLVTFYNQDKTRRLVSVTRKDHRGSWRLLRRDAERVRLRGAAERVGLIDGAVCLRRQLERLPLTALGLDFYHLGENVHAGKRATFGENSPAGEAWAGRALHAARHEGYQPFWDHLVAWRSDQRRRPGPKAAADALLHYVAERREMIRYDQFERHGWDVGTGPMESMCKATTRRLKGQGMRWDLDNAEAMMALESLRQSRQWDCYWKRAVWNTG